MPPPTNQDFLILKGPVLASSDFSPIFLFFILHFYYLQNASLFSISYFKAQQSAPYVANGLIYVYRFLSCASY